MPAQQPDPEPKVSAYPNLEEEVGADKLSDVQTDKQSNNSEDSGVAFWSDPKSVVERNRQLLESQMSCDVIFYVGEKRERMGAHKYVLMTRSDAFVEMFSNPEQHEFEVPDVSPDNFWEVLRHIYCEDQNLQVISVVGIMAAADTYKLTALWNACQNYLHSCLKVENACYLLMETRKYGYAVEEKTIMVYIRKNAKDVFQTSGMLLLSKDLMDMLMNLPNLDIDEETKKDVMEKWKMETTISKELKHSPSQDPLNNPMQDCIYVEREDNECHRYIMDSVTSRDLFDEIEEIVVPPNAEITSPTDETDKMSTITSTSSLMSRSSVHTYSRLPSCNMWPELDMVTRLQEMSGSAVNDARFADAISFNVNKNIYLFGFSIYGPKKEGEGRFKVDTILMRKKREVVMESIVIHGAGVILPVLFERPVKVDKDVPYTLEVYITGPDSHMGASGQSTLPYKNILFTFSNAVKVKHNRSNVISGQIPRLLFMPRNK